MKKLDSGPMRQEPCFFEIGGPKAKGRFQNAQTPIGMVSGDVKWNNIRNFLRTRLAALESICKAP